MKETSKIYVDIASLFDLRQAALQRSTNNEEKLIEYLLSEEYNFRETDNFSICDQEKYKSAINSEDIKLLELSSVTHILTNVKTKIDSTEHRNSYQKEKKAPEVVLNIYPFKLNESQRETLQNLLFVKLRSECIITIAYITPEELTPSFIDVGGFAFCFIYDFPSWIEPHAKALETTKIKDCVLHFASIHKNDLTKEEEKAIIKLGFKDVFSYAEFLLSPVVNIRFLPVVFYSNVLTAIYYLEKFNNVLKTEKAPSSGEDVDLSKFNLPEDL